MTLQAWIFFRADLDYYDAFSNLSNARTLAGVNVGYQIFRPPLIPVLHAPLQKAMDAVHAGAGARLRLPHLLQCLLSMACLIAMFRYLSRFFSPGWAHLGVVLFSLNRLTIHYFGSVMGDIPSALFFLLFLQAMDASPPLAAAALACCLLCRWNMPVLLFAVLAYYIATEKGRSQIPRLKTAALGAFLAAGACFALYCVVLRIPPLTALRYLTVENVLAYQAAPDPSPFWAYARGLCASAGIACVVFFLLGLWACARKQEAAHRLHTLLFAFYLCLMSLGGHKETRYLYCVLPFFYCLVLLGMRQAYARYESLAESSLWKRAGARAALALLLPAAFASGAVREWARFRDPAYADPVLFDALNAVKDNVRPGSRIFWTGSVYSLHPKDPVFIPEDHFYYVYDIPSPGSLEYLLGGNIPSMNDSLFKTLRDGDIMIRAPLHPFRLWEPAPAEEARIEVVQRAGNQWKRLALLPRGSS